MKLGHKVGIALIGLLILMIAVLASPPAHGHFDANDWDHNQAHFDTPINPQPETEGKAQPQAAPQPQASKPTSTTVVTADQQVVVVPNQTRVVTVRRSFWDSNFWNAVNVNIGYGNYNYNGYNGCYGCGYNYYYRGRYYGHPAGSYSYGPSPHTNRYDNRYHNDRNHNGNHR